jgi:hypothetical protein
VLVTTLGVAHVLRLTHYGVELDVRHDQDEVHAALLVDVESAIWLNLKIANREIVTMRPDKPAKIRYKAVGSPRRAAEPADHVRSRLRFIARLHHRPGRLGLLRVLPGLLGEDIIKVLGARIARTNPLNIEVDPGSARPRVVKVDRFGIRLPIDPLGDPSITAIG